MCDSVEFEESAEESAGKLFQEIIPKTGNFAILFHLCLISINLNYVVGNASHNFVFVFCIA